MKARAAGEIYGAALSEGARIGLTTCRVVGDDGTRRQLPLDRWLGPPDLAEKEFLARALAPVLDVGCGAGRHVAWLKGLGVPALGIDVAPVAVALARGKGATVLRRSIFDGVPGAGNWGSALLLDGNIGIGGKPASLLARLRGLLRPGGDAFIELEPPGVASRRLQVRLEDGTEVSDWLPWAWVSVDDIEPLATAVGLELGGRWSRGPRWFARLRRPAPQPCRSAPTGTGPGDVSARTGDVTVSQYPEEDNLSIWR